MLVRRIAIGTAVAAAMTGCASIGPYPASASEAIALVDAGPACTSTLSPAASSLAASSQTRPPMLLGCFAQFPKFLEARRIAGECRMSFDVDDAGIPTQPVSSCFITTPGLADQQLEAIALAAFQRASERSLMATRYAPADPVRPDEVRKNLTMSSRFDFR